PAAVPGADGELAGRVVRAERIVVAAGHESGEQEYAYAAKRRPTGPAGSTLRHLCLPIAVSASNRKKAGQFGLPMCSLIGPEEWLHHAFGPQRPPLGLTSRPRGEGGSWTGASPGTGAPWHRPEEAERTGAGRVPYAPGPGSGIRALQQRLSSA